MIICWSAKGGSGTTVVACALAIIKGRDRPTLLVDLAGDVPATLGLTEPSGPGVADWATSPVGDLDALGRLGVHVAPNVHLLWRGNGTVPVDRIGRLHDALAQVDADVVVDAGVGAPAAELVDGATSLLVVRPCYLALRRIVTSGVTPNAVVVVNEPGRALTATDVGRAVGAPVVANLPFDPAVSRAVDAGMLSTRLPRTLDRGLEDFA